MPPQVLSVGGGIKGRLKKISNIEISISYLAKEQDLYYVIYDI